MDKSMEERLKLDFLHKCQTVKQVLLDCDYFEKRVRKSEQIMQSMGQTDGADAARKRKDEYEALYVELVNRKDLYKSLVGTAFETPLDLPPDRKREAKAVFDALDGFGWSNPFGWIGQNQNVTRPEIGAIEGPVSVYNGVVMIPPPSAVAGFVGQLQSKQQQQQVESNPLAGMLTEFDLSGFGCRGQLPSSMSFLNLCKIVNLQCNRLYGPLPTSAIRQWSQVRQLKLAGNELRCQGEGLSALQYLINLEILDLSFNELTGTIPDIFTSTPKLEILNLAGNYLEGEIPSSITTLVSLKELKLQSNRLTGSIPLGFRNNHCKSIRHINLSKNRLTSGAIDALHGLTTLEVVMLNNNEFRGRLDGSVFLTLKNVIILYLHNNQLSGIIPNELCTLKKLKYCNLSSNHFRGRIPEDIGELISVEKLLLCDNILVGPVPRSIGLLISHLRDFYVFKPYTNSDPMTQRLAPSISIPPRKFNAFAFERVYLFGPSVGIDSVHWNHDELYGAPRDRADDEMVTIFSGKL